MGSCALYTFIPGRYQPVSVVTVSLLAGKHCGDATTTVDPKCGLLISCHLLTANFKLLHGYFIAA